MPSAAESSVAPVCPFVSHPDGVFLKSVGTNLGGLMWHHCSLEAPHPLHGPGWYPETQPNLLWQFRDIVDEDALSSAV